MADKNVCNNVNSDVTNTSENKQRVFDNVMKCCRYGLGVGVLILGFYAVSKGKGITFSNPAGDSIKIGKQMY